MIGAATSRRAAVRSAATALVLALAAGTGCGSPAAQPRTRAPAAARLPQSVRVLLPRVQGGLPWPVVLRTSGGGYVVTRSGAIHGLPDAAPRARARVHPPPGALWVQGMPGTWAMMRGGHLLIARNRAVIWRSAATYPARDAVHMQVIVAGRPGVAFEVRRWGPLFMAGWHGPEHRVAAAAWPDMWTRSGNLIGMLHRRGSQAFGYAVFSPSGTRLATLATGLRGRAVGQRYDDLATGTFWYLTGDGDLMRTDGKATTVVASTRAVGLPGRPEVGILGGGLIQFLSPNWRGGQVILYPDGQVFARIPAPAGQAAGFGQVLVSPGSRMVAYILTRKPFTGSTVFVVRPGSAPVAVYRTAHGSSPCAFPPLAWHGSWLLYTPPGTRAVLINTAGSHRVIRLPATLPDSTGYPVPVDAASWR